MIVASLGAGVGAFSGDFFVEGQIKRQGWLFIVSLNSLMFWPVGPRSLMVTFNFSDELRRFWSVISMLLLGGYVALFDFVLVNVVHFFTKLH